MPTYPSAAALTIVAFSLGCPSQRPRLSEASAESAAKPRRVKAMALEEESHGVESTGTALPVREAILSASVPGRIVAIPVVLGQEVKKGQALVRLDPYGFSLGVEQAEAGLAAATVQADQAKRELDRIERLVSAKVAPGATQDQVRAGHDAAQAQKKVSEAGLKQAQKALSDSTLRAPFDGTVDQIFKEVGEYAPSMPPTMLVKIVDTSALSIQLHLPENRTNDVSVGMAATVEIESAGITTDGQVVFVSNRIQPGTQTFEVRVEIDNDGETIKGGAFARVTLGKPATGAGILLPTHVIQTGDDGTPYVYVIRDGTARQVAVTLGETKYDSTVITGGLDRQHPVITTQLSALSDGDPVSPELN